MAGVGEGSSGGASQPAAWVAAATVSSVSDIISGLKSALAARISATWLVREGEAPGSEWCGDVSAQSSEEVMTRLML